MFGIGYSQVSILLFVVLIPVLHLLLGVWIGHDAARWGESGAVWAVGTLVGGVLGPALSLALRKPAARARPDIRLDLVPGPPSRGRLPPSGIGCQGQELAGSRRRACPTPGTWARRGIRPKRTVHGSTHPRQAGAAATLAAISRPPAPAPSAIPETRRCAPSIGSGDVAKSASARAEPSRRGRTAGVGQAVAAARCPHPPATRGSAGGWRRMGSGRRPSNRPDGRRHLRRVAAQVRLGLERPRFWPFRPRAAPVLPRRNRRGPTPLLTALGRTP